MPLPPAIPLFLFHPNPASTCAARAGASSLLAAALARDLWRRTPEWIREDDVWKSLLADEGGGSGGHKDEMASLAAVIQKLQALIVTGYEKLGSERRSMRRRRTARGRRSGVGASTVDSQRERVLRKSTSECLCQVNGALCHLCTFCRSQEQSTLDSSATTDSPLADPITPLEWHAALLAYVQLSNQIKERYPYWRDRMYETVCEFDHEQDECGIFYDDNHDADADKCTNRVHNESPGQVGSIKLDNQVPKTVCRDEKSDQRLETNERIYYDSSPSQQNYVHKGTITSQGVPITVSEVKELKTMLDYAVWAYEPDEEILRNLLKADIHTYDSTESLPIEENGTDGYQLLLHRTTSYIEPLSGSNNTKEKPATKSTNKLNSSKKLRKPPGRVGYFVAVSHSKKELLIGMKGTSTLEEILTDCCGRAVRLELEHDPHHPSPSNYYSCKREDTTKVSLFSSESMSQLEIIEVELIHYEESIQPESHDTNNLLDPSNSLSSTLTEQEAFKRHNIPFYSSNFCPPAAENVVLLPSYESGEVTTELDDDNDQKQQQSAASSPLKKSILFHEEVLESCGIEMQPERTTKLRGAHEGILHCAQQLFYEITPLIEEFALSKGYDIVCTGHSLGAGTASLLALLIRGRYPELVVPRKRETDCGNEQTTTERVRVYAFASPPVLDRASALACRHYVTSVVNNSDIIPRSSLTNLDVLLTMLEAVRARLLDLGMNPDGNTKLSLKGSGNDFCQKPKNIFASLVALFQKLSEGTEGNLLIDPFELQEVWDEAVADASLGDDGIYWSYEGDHHLLVPGKVLIMYEPWSSVDQSEQNSREEQNHVSSANKSTEGRDANKSDQMNPVYRAIWAYGTTKLLKGFEIGAGGKLVTDHLTSSYYKALASLEQDLTSRP